MRTFTRREKACKGTTFFWIDQIILRKSGIFLHFFIKNSHFLDFVTSTLQNHSIFQSLIKLFNKLFFDTKKPSSREPHKITQTQHIHTFFVQKYIFSSKNLRICIFCSTFAADFEKRVFWARWRDGRVVDCGGLENRWAERLRGFESLSLRQNRKMSRGEKSLLFFVYIKYY